MSKKIFKSSKGFEFKRTETGWVDLASGIEWKIEIKTNINQYDAEKWALSQGLRLPTIEEFKIAEDHGIRELPDMQWKDFWFWSSTAYSGYAYYDYAFSGYNGTDGNTGGNYNRNVSYYNIAARAISEVQKDEISVDSKVQEAVKLLKQALKLLGEK